MERILVLPNPFTARDRDGTPCGTCPRDPEHDGGGPLRFVGAKVDPTATTILHRAKAPGEHPLIAKGDVLRSVRQKTFYKYLGIPSTDPELAVKLAAATPVDIPLSRYYRDRLREGSIIVADEESAKKARVRFHSPIKVFGVPVPPPAAPVDAPTVEVAPDAPTGDAAQPAGLLAAASGPLPDVRVAEETNDPPEGEQTSNQRGRSSRTK